MEQLSKEEEQLLKKICKESDVEPDHLRILLLIEKDYSYKSTSRHTACRKELLKNIEIWTRNK